ncbi:MAG: EAL domain-containing protein [Actinomycetota bacterium]|nr:EAL domain-containing protein [Actinomycetota bacterium]
MSDPRVLDATLLDRLTAARVLDLTPDLGLVTDFAGRIVWANVALGRHIGATDAGAGAVIGRHVSELVHPDDRANCTAAWLELASGDRDTAEVELRFGTDDSGWGWFLGSAGADHAAGLIVATHQQTGALREAEERFRRSFEDAAIGMAITALDGTFVRVNRSLATMLGSEPEDLAGTSVRSHTHPDDRAGDMAAMRELASGVRSSYRTEKRYLAADGREVWVALGVSVVGDAEHTPQYFISQMVDISERRAAELALAVSEAEYRMLADHATDIISRHAVDGPYRYASPAAQTVLGYEPAELIGRTPHDLGLVHADDAELVERAWGEALASCGATKAVHRAQRRDGSTVWLESVFRCVFENGKPAEIMCVARDVSERRNAEAELAHRALHDALTGLPNRTLFGDRLAQALRRVRRTERGVAVLFIDLDRFKVVNDSLGHKAGDRLLVDVTARLSAVLRPSDTLARFGGDELTLVCEQVAGENEAIAIAERVLGAFAEPFPTGGDGEAFLQASIGIAVSRHGFETPDDLIRDADTAMYRAKQSGGGRADAFDADMRRDLRDRVGLETALRRGIARGELLLHGQPIVDMRDGSVQGFEALVRWQHPERGLVQPSDFIPMAEETGAILELGAWVLREACATLARVHAETGRTHLQVGINIAPRQIQQPGFCAQVRAAIADHGLEPDRIVLEITESTMLESGDDVIATLRELRDLGVRLAMDDFGTGYSSLAALHRFPLHIIKVDRSFVAHVGDDQGASIAAAIVSMAKALGLICLAEGIEDERQRVALLDLGCHLAQGFLFARPMPVADLTRALCASI